MHLSQSKKRAMMTTDSSESDNLINKRHTGTNELYKPT